MCLSSSQRHAILACRVRGSAPPRERKSSASGLDRFFAPPGSTCLGPVNVALCSPQRPLLPLDYNEIYQRDDPRGQEIAKTICKVIKSEDTTRPTILANCDYWDQPGKTWDKDSYRAFENVDLGGYNYGTQFYEKDHAKYPERIIVGTENYPSAIGGTWKFVEEHPYVIGDFVWTAIDYVGEAGVGHTFERTNDAWVQLMSWPWFNAWCGDIDLTGQKKPQSYYRDVVWRRSNIEMAVRPAIPQGEHEEVRGWGWTAEERHWNWGNYLPFELRPENYQSENMRRSVPTMMRSGYLAWSFS